MATKKPAETKSVATQAAADQLPAAGPAVTDQLPDYLRNVAGDERGREDVTADDLVIPRLEVVQALSPCRKRSDPEYIDGAEEGMLYNNLTRELYGPEVQVIPVVFRKEWIIWKSRKEGGGFRGAFASQAEAEVALSALEDRQHCEIIDTPQYFCLALTPDGRVEEVVISMAKSKAKVSRKWNSLQRLAAGPSFSRVYRLSSITDTNAKNEEFINFAVAPAGYPSEVIFRQAEKLYEAVNSGKRGVDRSGSAGDAAPEGRGEY